MKKILYVEDNEDTAQAVKILLENSGYHVDIVSNNHECRAKVKKKDYDVFLLDLLPPEMYGYDVFEELSKESKGKYALHSHVPLSPGIMRLLKKAGISDHITKPFNKVDLINRLDGLFR